MFNFLLSSKERKLETCLPAGIDPILKGFDCNSLGKSQSVLIMWNPRRIFLFFFFFWHFAIRMPPGAKTSANSWFPAHTNTVSVTCFKSEPFSNALCLLFYFYLWIVERVKYAIARENRCEHGEPKRGGRREKETEFGFFPPPVNFLAVTIFTRARIFSWRATRCPRQLLTYKLWNERMRCIVELQIIVILPT